MVLLCFRKGTSGFDKSRSQASRFVSVTVTRGGGLNVDGAVHLPITCRFSMTWVKRYDSVCNPIWFF
jgi:hypothetical protein